MTEVYTYPKWLTVVCVLFTIGFGVGVGVTIQNAEYTISLICGGFVILGVLGTIDAKRYYLEVLDDKLVSHQLFRVKELLFEDVKEIVVDENYLRFLPKSKNHKKIRVSRYVSDYGELVEWAHSMFTNSEIESVQEEFEEIYANEDYGNNLEERLENLSGATKKSKVLNSIAWVVAIWGLFYPKPYEWLIGVLILYPLIAIFMIWHSKGLISIGGKDTSSVESARPSVMTSIFFPGLILGLRALLDCSIYSYGNSLFLVLALAVILSIPTVKALSGSDMMKTKDYIIMVPLIALMFGFYSYGAVFVSNSLLDKSIPSLYTAQILNKHMVDGKSDSYYLQLTPWGPENRTDDAEVPAEFYKSVSVGDTIHAWYFEGHWKVPWYEITSYKSE